MAARAEGKFPTDARKDVRVPKSERSRALWEVGRLYIAPWKGLGRPHAVGGARVSFSIVLASFLSKDNKDDKDS